MTLAMQAAAPHRQPRRTRARSRGRRKTSLLAHGEPMIWLTGGALVLAMAMIVGLLLGVLYFGGTTFWPLPVERFRMLDGSTELGEVTRAEHYEPDSFAFAGLTEQAAAEARRTMAEHEDGQATRLLVRVGNRDLTGVTFRWLPGFEVAEHDRPEWALTIERLAWGRFFGTPTRFLVDGEVVAEGSEAAWERFQREHGPSRERYRQIRSLERIDIGRVNRRLEDARLRLRTVELDKGLDSREWQVENERFLRVEREVEDAFAEIRHETQRLRSENDRYRLVVTTSSGAEKPLVPEEIVRAYPANRLSTGDKIGIYVSRWWEFLTDEPRESNSEGGVLPAIVGTVVMTLLMSIVVVPFGVLAALYLREYAKQGFIISTVRIAVNNLAGVPSIVFGVFGLGFFCYIIGASIDDVFFEASLPNPTFGKGGVLWASLTLALLTLPVVIVATEEALAAVPNSMREGSYACGATKWQTIRRIVLPRAAPGIMTGTILAIARGAGEVAPLMLVGAVKLAPYMPVDLTAPFVHPSRSFMHLGFHIFDLGFQSPDSEAAKPMVFTTTLLLIAIVVVLNLLAVWIRARLRRKYLTAH